MPVFRYIATTNTAVGEPRRGELVADSAYQVRLALRRMGLLPVKVTEHRPRQRLSSLGLPGLDVAVSRVLRSRRRAKLVEAYESLAALVATGTPIASALELVAGDGDRSQLGTLFRALGERLRHGSTLADAMSEPEAKQWFSPIDIALVRIAEQDGQLERALADLAEYHARGEQITTRIAGALAYPALLMVFGVGVAVFLTTTTLPPLAEVLHDGGVKLPTATTLLLSFGSVLTEHWTACLAALISLAMLALWGSRHPRLARLRLRTPLLGKVIQRGQLGEACIVLSRLLAGGVPLTDALDLVSTTIGNPSLCDGLCTLRSDLAAGRDPMQQLNQSGLFEPVFCRVIEVGQASGELGSALATLGSRYQSSASRLTTRLTNVLEPAAILVLAVMVGFVVYAAITPMLRLAETIR